MKYSPMLFGFLALIACSPKPGDAPPPQPATLPSDIEQVASTEAPAGDYTLDKSHASLTFKVNHTGFSNYTAQFKSFDANLKLDPEKPETASVNATVDVKSLDIPTPPEGFLNTLLGPVWFDTAKFPQISFRSTKIDMTGPDTAKIDGDLTLKGVTKPITLEAKFNGGYAGFAPYDPAARIGFSAKGKIKRSDFGMTYGIPEPGTTMGVGDEVEIMLEAEFTGPPLEAAASSATATPAN
ncbi:YceI family protein [Asticcacaulis endophyticus]|uniref:Polyisoprenoid-binding protein n=1 Tax=Asticcacaulis endophyticus TaxID=1395890 RepID=A0A918PW77_9CAUL|nr:YceI family protein [Asticcacaulis endophyticus]GGZ23152.1 polyisoprenoid-binding protein [Asticcacaulis endophyticus]